MDKRIKQQLSESTEPTEFICGFEFAIELLRSNKFYGHYAEGLADWLDDHLKQDMPDPTPTRLK